MISRFADWTPENVIIKHPKKKKKKVIASSWPDKIFSISNELRALWINKDGCDDHGREGGCEPGGKNSIIQQQAKMSDEQTHPLAHPKFVLGIGDHSKETLDYVAARGQGFISQPLPDNVEIGQPKQCFMNASLLVLQREDLTYAEGFAQIEKLPDITFLHAWAVDKSGNVIDPTWDKPEKAKYFGVKYDRTKYLKYIIKTKVYGVLGNTRKNSRKAVETGGSNLL